LTWILKAFSPIKAFLNGLFIIVGLKELIIRPCKNQKLTLKTRVLRHMENRLNLVAISEEEL
jgi:hypothetical protein